MSIEVGTSDQHSFPPKDGAIESRHVIHVLEPSPGVRKIQVSLDVNDGEYVLTSHALETSIKGAELAIELIRLLFGKRL
jgi:hypothetical protein